MKNRTTVLVFLLVLVVLLPVAAAADGSVPLERAWKRGYVGACLSRSGLSLSDETPLAALEAEPFSGASYGDSSSNGGCGSTRTYWERIGRSRRSGL